MTDLSWYVTTLIVAVSFAWLGEYLALRGLPRVRSGPNKGKVAVVPVVLASDETTMSLIKK